jgi:hypothetical protein
LAAACLLSAGQDQLPKAETNGKAAVDPQNGLTPLNKQGTVLIDKAGKRVLLKTKVVLREGMLEMLCCPQQTKEHESILAVDSMAYTIHAGLLAIGAKAGQPVRYFPDFVPPSGQRIDIFLTWKDEKGKLSRKPAQSWIRYSIHRYYVAKFEERPKGLRIPADGDLRYDDKHNELIWYGPMTAAQRDMVIAYSNDKKYREAIQSFFEQGQSRPMDSHWVFTGSGFYVDPQSNEKFYEAEGGDLICVSNFPSSMIDVAIRSSPEGQESLLFEAYTEHIPPVGTDVTIELIPSDEKEASGGEAKSQAP